MSVVSSSKAESAGEENQATLRCVCVSDTASRMREAHLAQTVFDAYMIELASVRLVLMGEAPIHIPFTGDFLTRGGVDRTEVVEVW